MYIASVALEDGILFLPFPKGNSPVDPTLGNCSFPQAEAMGQAGKNFNFSVGPVAASFLWQLSEELGQLGAFFLFADKMEHNAGFRIQQGHQHPVVFLAEIADGQIGHKRR